MGNFVVTGRVAHCAPRVLAARAALASVLLGAAASIASAGCGSPAKPPEAPPVLDAGASLPAEAATDAGASAAADAAPLPAWQEVESSVCNVKAKMLGAPKESVKTVSTDQGPAKLTMLMYVSPDNAYAMGIMCSEVAALRTSKASNDHILDGSRDGMVKNVHGTLTSEKPLVFGGFPARQVAVTSKGQPVHARIVFMRPKGKIMTIISVGLEDETATAFIDSVAFR